MSETTPTLNEVFPGIENRGKKGAIADAEWIVTLQMEIKGEPVGASLDLRYADSVLAKHPPNVGMLIAAAMNERARVLKPRKGKR